jgi:phenylacetate-coenzyme A ligase PaaK-like adenylate-forming protein
VFSKERNTLIDRIFSIQTKAEFDLVCMEVFQYQVANNPVYSQWLKALTCDSNAILHVEDIPFMPIEFFKTHRVISGNEAIQETFTSSGTTGLSTSSHYICDTEIYKRSYLEGFMLEYGNPRDWVIIGLLPAYLDRPGSSLVYMTQGLIEASGKPESGFYLYNIEELKEKLAQLADSRQKVWLIGVSFALLDLAEISPSAWPELVVVETGGMKGRRKELIRKELHLQIKRSWPIENLHSEYGMTELLSQAWMKKDERFVCPPWMKIFIRDASDPFQLLSENKNGGIQIIDLANIDTCSFITTSDLGKKFDDQSFEVIGRFDNSDIRGCNLLVDN